MSTVRDRQVRRLAGDEGSVLAEFALFAPIMVFMVLGIFEFGMGWRNSIIIASSIRGGARTLAQSQNTATADMQGLLSYQGSIAQGRNIATQKIIIYNVKESTNPSGAVPSLCLSASAPDNTTPKGVSDVATSTNCNIYTPAQLTSANLVAANFGCSSASSYDKFFCASTRSITLTGSGPSTIGMYAEVKYTTLTRLLKTGAITIKDKSSARIEPTA